MINCSILSTSFSIARNMNMKIQNFHSYSFTKLNSDIEQLGLRVILLRESKRMDHLPLVCKDSGDAVFENWPQGRSPTLIYNGVHKLQRKP